MEQTQERVHHKCEDAPRGRTPLANARSDGEAVENLIVEVDVAMVVIVKVLY